MNFIIESNRIFYEEKGKLLAEVTFPAINDGIVDINHTFVDESLRGQGVAGKLIEAAMSEIRKMNLKAKCSCSYAKVWNEKHFEYSDLIITE